MSKSISDEFSEKLESIRQAFSMPENVMEKARALIPAEKHAEFNRFVSTGDASDEFISYLESDQGAQSAVEICFNASCAGFERVARMLQGSSGG